MACDVVCVKREDGVTDSPSPLVAMRVPSWDTVIQPLLDVKQVLEGSGRGTCFLDGVRFTTCVVRKPEFDIPFG